MSRFVDDGGDLIKTLEYLSVGLCVLIRSCLKQVGLVYFLTRRLDDRSEFQSEIETTVAEATIPIIRPSSLII
jgi:hypothetical protein